ncbi:MAG: DNA methyltransferase [Cyanobacteria bacterium P01_H01_bin.58]
MRSPPNSSSPSRSIDPSESSKLLAQALQHHHRAFQTSLVGLENASDRCWYAQIVINRLLLLYDLQVAGFLGKGDRWYLHIHLGQSQQTQPNRFYSQCFLPLCQQGIGLPESERPLTIHQRLGTLPYLGGRLFQPHPLEAQHPNLTIPDAPFESFLGWLAEQTWRRVSESEPDTSTPSATITRTALAAAFERINNERTGQAYVSTPTILAKVCDRTLDAYVLQAVRAHHQRAASSVNELLQTLNTPTCRLLIETVLPTLTILDPACGSGRFLHLALTRLQQLYTACWQYAKQAQDPTLQAWVNTLEHALPSPGWHLLEQILTRNLHGVDINPVAIAITQLQLWLALLSTAKSLPEIGTLPDLDLNITTGNALVGFIQVDEERFDRILPKKSNPASHPETVLQGNLLQPLAAASYRDTLTEKQIRLEHYHAQTKAMAETASIPKYVQTEFLRDRVFEVNQTAQLKLNRLLLQTLSQTLGIRLQEPRSITKRVRRRVLRLEDIVALQPFHWGFFFNRILSQHGGFDVILTHPPANTLLPSAYAFYTEHTARFRKHGIEWANFQRSRKAILQAHPDLAELWAIYAGRLSVLRNYFRRSDTYQIQATPKTARSLRLTTLFAQRCFALMSERGIQPYIH